MTPNRAGPGMTWLGPTAQAPYRLVALVAWQEPASSRESRLAVLNTYRA
jgi:hypothetical protein